MGEIHNTPVSVTGYEERRHPAIRQLARACIALARLRLERKTADEPSGDGCPRPAVPEQGASNG